MGLVSMRERADLVNGRWIWRTPSTGGALVRLTVPRHRLLPRRRMPEPTHYRTPGGRPQPGAPRLPPHAGRRSGDSVVGEAEDGQQAVQLAAELRPRVVVMDFALPSMNGAVAARQILRTAPETAILILSMHSEAVLRSHLPGGRRARIPAEERDGPGNGGRRETGGGRQAGARPAAGIARAVPRPSESLQLTTRELEVLQLIVHGKSNKEIAAVLGLSANTVAVHRANIMQTLGIHNTAELVVYAIRQGLVSIA